MRDRDDTLDLALFIFAAICAVFLFIWIMAEAAKRDSEVERCESRGGSLVRVQQRGLEIQPLWRCLENTR